VIDPSARIHATADIEDGVSIGEGTSIWHRAQVRTGARIGRECIVGRDAFIDQGVSLGNRVKIQNGALVYHGVTVADGVFIGPGAILTNDRNPRATTSAGDLARAADWAVSPIHLAEGSSIGAGAIVVAGCDVGRFAMVGAGAIVTHDVPAHALVAGNPARVLGWVCACGRRLHDATGHAAPATRDRYAIDSELACPVCGRRYAFGGDDGTLQQQSGPAITQGATA
jgi:acetyltransferase-like isoleucine patch superfamily enzyme